MPTIDCHPSRQDLEAFALGRLRDDAHAAVEEHVNDCRSCQQVIDQAPGDAFVSLLRTADSVSDMVQPLAGAATMADALTDTPPVAHSMTCAWPLADAGSMSDLPAALTGHPRYEPTRLLGSGGMGTVWLARHRVMGRQVAVKVIRPEFVAKPGAAERFRRESQAAARLQHPNIVTAFDAENAGDTHLLAMEYVEGVTLAELVRERGPMPVQEACDAIRQAALGLQHAFDCGLIHRDLKPHNLMRTADGTVKILDFGLAVLADANRGSGGLTAENVVLGTPDYIAPEQAEESHAADVRSDVYSLGCTLYHLLTGHVPFPGDSVLRKLDAHRNSKPEPIRNSRPEVPADLAAIVTKMMAKKPADRFQTPAEVAAALGLFVTSTAPVRTRRWPWPGVAAALLFASLIAAGGVVFYVKTDNATIEIQTDDDNVKILAERKGKQVTVIDPKSKQTWVVDTGEWTVRLDSNPEGLKIEMPDTFTLKRGGRQVVTVKRVAKGGLLFKDDFDTPEPLAAPLFTREYMSFEHIKGEGVLTPRKHGVVPAMYLKTKVADFYSEVDIRVPSPARDSGYGLLFRSTDIVAGRLDGYYALWLHPGRGMITLNCWQEPRWTLRKEYPLKQEIFSARDTNRLRLEAVGDEFRVFLNGAFVCQFTNKRLQGPGLLGLGVGDVNDKAEAVYFANFRVYVPRPPEKVGEVRRFVGHEGPIRAVAYSPDGRYILSGSGYPNGDRTVRLWDVAAGKEIRLFEGHTDQVFSVAFSPDGRRVLSGGGDRTIRLWEVQSGKEIRSFQGHAGSILSLAFSPDGRYALSGGGEGDCTVRLSDVETGKEIRKFETGGWVVGVAFSPDGHRAFSASNNGTVRVWEVETGKELRSYQGTPNAISHAVACSPDGHLVIFGDGAKLVLWNVETGKVVREFGGGATSVAFSPDGRRVLCGVGKVLQLWDVESGRELHRFAEHLGGIWAVAFSPDGRHAISGSADWTIRLWRLPDPHQTEIVGQVHLFESHKDYVHSIAVSRDGRYAVSGGGGKILGGQMVLGAKDYDIRLWDLERRTEVRRLTGSEQVAACVAISPDGRLVLSGSGLPKNTIRLWDAETSKELKRVDGDQTAAWSLAFSPDGRQALSASSGESHVFCLWDVEGLKKVKDFEGHTAAVRRALFSPDGRRALSTSFDGTARLWDIESGKELKRFEGQAWNVWEAAFSPDGSRVLTGGNDHSVRLWDAESGKELKRFEGHKAPVNSVAFSPDGRFALSAGGGNEPRDEEDFSLRLWDLESGKELHRFEGHRDVVKQVLWLPDGCHALSCSWDTTVRLWRLPDLHNR